MVSSLASNIKNSKGKRIITLITRLFLFIIFISGLLFLPAGTLNWPEAWLYLTMYICYVIPTFLYLEKNSPDLLEKRTEFKPEKGWDMVFTVGATVVFILLFVIAGLDAVRYRWSAAPIELRALVFVGIISSFIILFSVMRENAYLFRTVKVEKGHEVVTTGPYGIVRHPMYAAMIIQLTCTSMALGSYYALIPATLIDVLIVIRTILEDKTLQKELEGYVEYTKKTPYRLLPGVW